MEWHLYSFFLVEKREIFNIGGRCCCSTFIVFFSFRALDTETFRRSRLNKSEAKKIEFVSLQRMSKSKVNRMYISSNKYRPIIQIS